MRVPGAVHGGDDAGSDSCDDLVGCGAAFHPAVFMARVKKAHHADARLSCGNREAIMYCSPTMYASGARVYYLTDLLYLFIILTLAFSLKKKRWRNGFYVGLLVAGVWNLVWQVLF